jgi:hypothetical protein
MVQTITGNLRNNVEFVFRQHMGAPAHIVVNIDHVSEPSIPPTIKTYCGREYTVSQYSTISRRRGQIRNACEDCFITYIPEGSDEERRRNEAKRKMAESDLPF